MTLADVDDAFSQYVFNEVPIRLINAADMRLYERNELKQLYHSRLNAITEGEIQRVAQELHVEWGQAITSIIKNLVRYAICSHRWSDDEVTYQQMIQGPIPTRQEYDKVLRFCRTATDSHSLQLAWIDACCINKDSSTELDESIRSMFRWYRNATVCIVHLAHATSIDKVATDSWFTRGWTLQELLAPHHLKFYYADWRPVTSDIYDFQSCEDLRALTSRDSAAMAGRQLVRAVTAATGIQPSEMGSAFAPGVLSVPARMQWAAGRKTTRGEDGAYCLMGIFNVSLATAYGEGAERAFFRLIEAMIQLAPNVGILNWAGEPSDIGHRTLAMPSSPRCYTRCPGGFKDFLTQEEFILTNRGLRIRLLVKPAFLVTLSSERQCTLSCALAKDLIAVEGVGFESNFALGVFDFDEDSRENFRGRCSAFLLHRSSDHRQWAKVETWNYITFEPSEWFLQVDLQSLWQVVYL
ncbi:HET-domain-containing protein [Paxillus ammoniavirescens]|nr:HET-domain-containing protein [Paxillus ammoniavirescens]